MLHPIPRQKTGFSTAQQSSVPSHSWKTCISPCQGFNILTSFYLLVLLSNSKPSYHRKILTTLNSIGIPSPVCFISLPTPHQIIWNIVSAESHPKKTLLQPGRFLFQGTHRETRGAEAIFAFCRSSPFESSLV